jgi:hypothetical protein
LTAAEWIAFVLPHLCEFVWVLCRVNNIEKADGISAILALMACKNEKKRTGSNCGGLAGARSKWEFYRWCDRIGWQLEWW